MESYKNSLLSSLFSMSIIHPIDTIKVYNQNNKKLIFNLKNLYKGFFTNIIFATPERAIKVGVYQNMKSNNYNTIICGITASFCQTLISTPGEYFKNNLQNKSSFNIKKLYRGYTLTVLRDMPFSIIFFNLYERLNEYTNKFNSGLISAGIGGAIVTPIDHIKTRYQTSNVSLIDSFTYLKSNFRSSLHSVPYRVMTLSGFYGINMFTYDYLSKQK